MNTLLRNPQSKELIRHSIIQAALTLFLQEGFEHVSMRKIADVIQYTPTTIYNYFQNKGEILHELFKMGFAKFNRALRNTFYETMDNPSDQRLTAMLIAYIEFSLDEPQIYQLIFNKNIHRVMKCMQTSLDLIDKESYEGMYLLIQVVRSLPADPPSSKDNAMELAFFVWSAVNGFTITLSPITQIADREQIRANAERFVQVLLHGILHQKRAVGI
jgi:AcrR family transcriptional regulator